MADNKLIEYRIKLVEDLQRKKDDIEHKMRMSSILNDEEEHDKLWRRWLEICDLIGKYTGNDGA